MMNSSSWLSASQWAHDTFGAVRLGDERRNKRVVAIAHDPAASLPAQMQDPAALEAAYRFEASARCHL